MDDVTIVFNIYVHNLNGMTLNVKYDRLLFYMCVSNESKLRMKSQLKYLSATISALNIYTV